VGLGEAGGVRGSPPGEEKKIQVILNPMCNLD
jgi:hypothetical protein